MTASFVAAGGPAACLATVERFVRAGVDLPILYAYSADANLDALIDVGATYARGGA